MEREKKVYFSEAGVWVQDQTFYILLVLPIFEVEAISRREGMTVLKSLALTLHHGISAKLANRNCTAMDIFTHLRLFTPHSIDGSCLYFCILYK